MAADDETWELNDEPGGGGGGGGQEDPGAAGDCPPNADSQVDVMIMEEEEEEIPMPKVAPSTSDAPKKEHVNVVFIGHVGA